MIWAVFKTMLLRLWRDKGALVLAFVLPGFIFAIFAAIFSNASGGNLEMRVALAVTSSATTTEKFSNIIQDKADFSVSFDETWDEATVVDRVALGTEDVGIVLRGDLSAPETLPILIISEPSREIASSVLTGQIRQMLADNMPGVMLAEQIKTVENIAGPYSLQQAARLNAATENVTKGGDSLIETRSALDGSDTPMLKDASVAYYAGATAILFLLFSAMQGAALSLEERGSGITDRLLLGPKGAASMMLGKFAFLTLQGTLQAFVILGVAALFFDVPILPHIPALLLASIASAAVAASIALLVAALSKSTVQMHTVSTFVVLLFSAIGGSMVPRFMMPDWLQSLGSFTPNAWAIDAFYGVLARGHAASEIMLPLAILTAITMGCLLAASIISHRLMRF